MDKVAAVVAAIVGLGLLIVAVLGLAQAATGAEIFAGLFARPTDIGGPLDWGPATVTVWCFRAFGADGEDHVLSATKFYGVVTALVAFCGAYLVYRVYMRLVTV